MTGFQTSVATVQSPAVEGDFANANPRFTLDSGPGALVAGAAGVTIGRFGWWSPHFVDGDGAPGFVHREQQGLITTYLAESGMVIPAGFALTLSNGGDFWVKNNSSAQALV